MRALVVLSFVGAVISILFNYGPHSILSRTLNITLDLTWVSWGMLLSGLVILGIFLILVLGITWFYRALSPRRTTRLLQQEETLSQELLDSIEQLQDTPENSTSQSVPEAKKRVEEKNSSLESIYRASLRFLGNASKDDFGQVFELLEWVHLEQGSALYSEGDMTKEEFFFVFSGELVEGPYSYRSGESFGVRQCLEEYLREEKGTARRAHTCVATSNTDLVRLSSKAVTFISTKKPYLLISFIKNHLARQFSISTFVLMDFFRMPTFAASGSEAAHLEPNPFLSWTQDLLQECATLYSADEDLLTALQQSDLDEITIYDYNPGDFIYKQGDFSPFSVFILLKGRVCVYTPGSPAQSESRVDLLEIGRGGILAGIEMFVGCKMLHTARALGVSRGAWVTIQQINMISMDISLPQENPLTRKLFSLIAPMTSAFGLYFARIMEHSLQVGLHTQLFRAGECIYRTREAVENLYIIVNGRVSVQTPSASSGMEPIKLEVGRGECIGEMSILSENQKHTSSVVALRDTQVVALSVKSLRDLNVTYPQIMAKLAVIMAKRLKHVTHLRSSPSVSRLTRRPALSSDISTITLFPTRSVSAIHVLEFAQALSSALSTHGTAYIVTRASIANLLKLQGDIPLKQSHTVQTFNKNQIMLLLSYLEERTRFLILVADGEVNSGDPEAEIEPESAETLMENWTQCCCRQADCVLILGHPQNKELSHPFFPSALERSLLWNMESVHPTLARKELVLLHNPNIALPKHTARWLNPRDVSTWHHVKFGVKHHYERLARHLSGNTCGIALGGGGARGLAHLGILQALEEQGLPVDVIGGTSQGAMMGAMYAMNDCYEGMVEDTRHFAAGMGNLWELAKDATLPVMSYFSGKRMNEALCDILSRHDVEEAAVPVMIEDLWISYFCVTTNITIADQCIHRNGCRGPLWLYVRASMTVLDYLPPMIDPSNQEILIDGGYVNNLAVDVLRDFYDPKIVIGIDVENKDGDQFKNVYDYGDYISGWWLLFHRFKEFVGTLLCAQPNELQIPRFSQLIGSLLYMNHNRNIRRFIDEDMMDLYVQPPLGNTMLLDYHKCDELVKIGYRYAKVKITEFRLLRAKNFIAYDVPTYHAKPKGDATVTRRAMDDTGVKFEWQYLKKRRPSLIGKGSKAVKATGRKISEFFAKNRDRLRRGTSLER